MAKTKANYVTLGKADAKIGGLQLNRPTGGWQLTAYLEGWQSESNEAAVLKSFGVTVAGTRPTRASRDAAKRLAAVQRRHSFNQRMQMCDKINKALTAVRGRNTGYQSKNIKRGANW